MKTHLKGFGLENFRVFKDYTWFDFAPITVLTGPNNSGKSSLNKALLFLQDNLNKGKISPIFKMVQDGVDDGKVMVGFDENGIVYDEDRTEEPTYFECFEPPSLSFDSKVHGLNYPNSTKFRTGNSDKLNFALEYNISNKESCIYQISCKIDKVRDVAENLFELEIYTMVGSEKKPVLLIQPCSILFDIELYNQIVEEKHQVNNLNNINISKEITKTSRIFFEQWFEENKFGKESKNSAKKVFGALKLTQNTNGSIRCNPIEQNLKNLDFWTSSRTEQKRIYAGDDSSEMKMSLEKIHRKTGKADLKEIFSPFTQIFGINGQLDSTYVQEQESYSPNIDGFSLPNFGYGYTQLASLFFKLIAHCYDDEDIFYNGSESMIILEEPEVNLHPNFQSKLADLFLRYASRFKIQFMIETHSEYMIRKFQYLVAKGRMKKEDIVIYYFHDPNNVPEGEPQVKKIEILEDGSLSSDFGTGFFDEATNWELELLRLKNHKNRQN